MCQTSKSVRYLLFFLFFFVMPIKSLHLHLFKFGLLFFIFKSSIKKKKKKKEEEEAKLLIWSSKY